MKKITILEDGSSRRSLFRAITGVLAIAFYFTSLPSAQAHHPFEEGLGTFSLVQGFFSGIAHPLLGPDHLLFLLSIGLVAGLNALRWVPVLLCCGFAGSFLSQLVPLIPGAEFLMGVSLIVAALVAVGRFNPIWMFPLMASHGYVLGQAIIGAEQTPLIAYFIGLFLIQSLVITIGILFMKKLWIDKKIWGGVLIGVGISLSLGTLNFV